MSYVIQRGDTLSALAKKFNTTVSALANTNNIKDINRIYAGQNLMLPGEVPATDHPLTSTSSRSFVPSNPAEYNARPIDLYGNPAPGSLPNSTSDTRILTSPAQIPFNTIQGQVGRTGEAGSYLYGTPRSLSPSGAFAEKSSSNGDTSGSNQSSPNLSASGGGGADANSIFNKTLQAMLQAAQGAGNEDLQAKRNAIIMARFNASRAATPDELRVLSPQAQASLRNLDTKGLEEQLSGVDAALKAREAQRKATIDAGSNILDFYQKQEALNKPIEMNGQLWQKQADGSYKALTLEQVKHSPSYLEWQDYVNSGGKLGFNDYMTLDANRKAARSSTTIINPGEKEADRLAKAVTSGQDQLRQGTYWGAVWNQLYTQFKTGDPTQDAALGKYLDLTLDKNRYYSPK